MFDMCQMLDCKMDFKLNLLYLFISIIFKYAKTSSVVPVINLEQKGMILNDTTNKTLKFLPFIMMIDQDKDTSEYWREMDIMSLVKHNEMYMDHNKCETSLEKMQESQLRIPTRRSVRPICSSFDFQQCPQCPRLSNRTECELFRDSCRERRVLPSEYRSYCDKKYGKWRSMFIAADYDQCRCCDECVFYRELDQSCVADEYSFDADEFLPVTTIDFRAGCNPYWGHPEQELRALRCDAVLRRCVPVSIPSIPSDTTYVRRSFRYEPPTGAQECHVSCRGYECPSGLVKEEDCAPGAFIPDKDQCNCCGKCSFYFQLNQKCAEFKKTIHKVNGTKEIEVEEEFIEPGCDDGLVCREGICQDIHTVDTSTNTRRRRNERNEEPYEPCRRELKFFKKKYGKDGHLHYNAPQCTPLWLYAPVQCRRFVCYCALEDGSFIEGIKVPRVEVSNMNCDCAREKCRTGSSVQCDGYGNYLSVTFAVHEKERSDDGSVYETTSSSPGRTGYEAAQPTRKIY